MSSFRPFLATMNSSSLIRQQLLSTGVCIMPIMGMGYFAKGLSSLEATVGSHRAEEELLLTSVFV